MFKINDGELVIDPETLNNLELFDLETISKDHKLEYLEIIHKNDIGPYCFPLNFPFFFGKQPYLNEVILENLLLPSGFIEQVLQIESLKKLIMKGIEFPYCENYKLFIGLIQDYKKQEEINTYFLDHKHFDLRDAMSKFSIGFSKLVHLELKPLKKIQTNLEFRLPIFYEFST